MFWRDKFTDSEQTNDPTHPAAKYLSPDRCFNRTVTHSIPMAGLELPKHKVIQKLQQTDRNELFKDIIKGKQKVGLLKTLFASEKKSPRLR